MRQIAGIKLFDKVQILDKTGFYEGMVGVVMGQNNEAEILVEFISDDGQNYACCWIPEELVVPINPRMKLVQS